MGKSKNNLNYKSKTFVLGDLHGAYRALVEVLRKAQFDYSKDTLIFIGDLADGWEEFDKCLMELLKIENFIPILGNHDLYILDYLKNNKPKIEWLKHGGVNTYEFILDNNWIIEILQEYFNKSKYYHIYKDKIFCHGGFNHRRVITNQKLLTFAINRQLFKTALKYEKQDLKFNVIYDEKNSIEIKEIFIGHSTTKSLKPEFKSNVINIDTGAGSIGCLTLMDVDNKKFVQSSLVKKLYKN